MSVKELGNPLGNPLAKPATVASGGAPPLKLVNESIVDWSHHLQNGISSQSVPTGTNWDDMMIIGKFYYDQAAISSYDAGLEPLSTTPMEEIGFIMPRDRSLPDSGQSSFDCRGIGQKWYTAIGDYSYRKQGQTFSYNIKTIYPRNHAYEGSTSYIYGRLIWRAYDNDVQYNAQPVYIDTSGKSWNDVFGDDYEFGYLFKGVEHYDDGHCSTWFSKGVSRTLSNLRQRNQHSQFNLIFDGSTFSTNTSGDTFQAFAYNIIE